MNEMEFRSRVEMAHNATDPASAARAPAPTAVKILMPVWGFRFVRQFLDLTLPTLLAPGNIPALARSLPCQFVILTSAADEQLIQEHRAWRALKNICSVGFDFIDDLIMDGNHSTTITLAYVRAMRQSGAETVNTCFLFLVSDYVVAEGALANVLSRMQNGASAVLAGNFQTIAEEAIPLLTRKLKPDAPELAIRPRELLRLTLGHLHPATTANIVNHGLSHNNHVNRLFWRVDETTLIGRFYLLHPIAIRPEVADFLIGSSFDYSLIPELCPSDQVEVMTDSDEYLVVELQPRDHEVKHLRWGPVDARKVARSLAEWTTARHRENVRHTLVYHAADLPANLAPIAGEADAFIAAVTRDLPPIPQPHRDHPYWLGAIAAHRAGTGQAVNPRDWALLLDDASRGRRRLVELAWRLRMAFFGMPPQVRPWHPRWPDYRPILQALAGLGGEGELLVVSDSPGVYAHWLSSRPQRATNIAIRQLLGYVRRQYLPLIGRFETCLVSLREGDLSSSDEILRRIGPLMKSGSHVLLSVTNDQPADRRNFADSFAYHSGRLANLQLWTVIIQYVRSNYLRWKVQRYLAWLNRGASGLSPVKMAFVALSSAACAVVAYVCNLGARRTSSEPPKRGCSSIFVVLRSSVDGAALPLPRFRTEREPYGSLELSAVADALANDRGAETLGIGTSPFWGKAPRQLASIFGRYGFVASLLTGRSDVGGYGCADALGTHVVLQEVKRLYVYDKDPALVDDVRRRHSEQWALEARVHDIVKDRLPRRHDSIYSLGEIEAVSPQDEELFVRHLRDSLERDQDILILGTSTADDEMHSPAARALYRRSGARLKMLLERYFHTVFIFSMIGDTVVAGNVEGAHYLFALCCAKKK